MKNQILNYKGNSISFLTGEEVMVNATEMARPFGKRPAKWLELPSTENYINTLKAIRKSDRLIDTVNGVGTWMHEDVALEFARWLSPEFAIWCNDRIKELVRHGFTATQDKLEELANNPDLLISLANQLKSERAEKERLAFRNQKQEEALKLQAPKVEFYNEVLQSESSHTTTVIAKELGMAAVSLNRKLKEKGIQYYQNGTWLLYSKYQNLGYTKTKTHPYYDSKGELKTSIQTVWTEKGRQFIHQVLK